MLRLCIMDETQIIQLYEQALSRDFPRNELKSLSAILNMYRRGLYDVIGAYEDETFVGYALLYCPCNSRLMLLDYFAVEPEHRRRGIGAVPGAVRLSGIRWAVYAHGRRRHGRRF